MNDIGRQLTNEFRNGLEIGQQNGLNQGVSFDEVSTHQDKIKEVDCEGLAARISVLNREFNAGTNALREQLDFQLEAEFTLFQIDRAIDAASGVVGGAVGSAVKGAVAARAAAAAAGTVGGQLALNGVVSRAGISTSGQLWNAAWSWGNFGVFGTIAGNAANRVISTPSRFGTDGVRDLIQKTTESLDSHVGELADRLTDLRSEYKTNCSGK